MTRPQVTLIGRIPSSSLWFRYSSPASPGKASILYRRKPLSGAVPLYRKRLKVCSPGPSHCPLSHPPLGWQAHQLAAQRPQQTTLIIVA